MITIILTKFIMCYLLLHGILGLLFKRSSNILGCGLAAYCGIEAPSVDKLHILGITNTSRGKDSCGIATGRNSLKGTASLSSYTDFCTDLNINYKNNFNTLIHTRRSTHGSAHTKDNAHPFMLGLDKEGKARTTTDPSKCGFIGMHNGSIHNTYLLREHYNLSSDLDMDSKVLLGSIYQNNNYKILSSYGGAAALVWYYTTKPNEIYVYKGENDKGESERTLYYYQVKKNNKIVGMYIASMDWSLQIINNNPKVKIKEFKGNTVYKITGGKMTKVSTVKRDPLFRKVVEEDIRSTENFYDEDILRRNHKVGPTQSKLFDENKSSLTSHILNKENLSVKPDHKYSISLICDKGQEAPPSMSMYIRESHVMNSPKHRVNYFCSRYWCNGNLLHGMFKINIDGFLVDKKEAKSYKKNEIFDLVFFRGILIEDRAAYLKIKKETKKNSSLIDIKEFSKVAKYPILSLPNEQDVWKYSISKRSTPSYKGDSLFSLNIVPLFTERRYTFEQGILKSIKSVNLVSSEKKGQRDSSNQRQGQTENQPELIDRKELDSSKKLENDNIEDSLLKISDIARSYGKEEGQNINEFIEGLSEQERNEILGELTSATESLALSAQLCREYFGQYESDEELIDSKYWVANITELDIVNKVLSRKISNHQFDSIINIIGIDE